jgi:hypothetical protein
VASIRSGSTAERHWRSKTSPEKPLSPRVGVDELAGVGKNDHARGNDRPGQLFGRRLGLGPRHLLHEERFGETALGAGADLLGRSRQAPISNNMRQVPQHV